MIARILVYQLFGIYNYKISFSEDQRITILTGPNGYGKTTLLKILHHLFTCQFWYFYFLPFASVQIVFEKGMTLIMEKHKGEPEDKHREDRTSFFSQGDVTFRLVDKEQSMLESFTLAEKDIRYLKRQLTLPYRQRYQGGLDWEELFAHSHEMDFDVELLDKSKNVRMFLQEHKCVFVKEQRIIASTFDSEPRKISNHYEIDDIAIQLRDEFVRQQTVFATESQKIDSSFIKRLVQSRGVKYDEDAFQEKLSLLKTKINDYKKYGLVPQIDILDQYPKCFHDVLSLYIDDMARKMSTFDRFYKQLSLFDRFVSDKVLSNKHIELNETKGFCVLNDWGEEIPLHRLSSGEQNLIILCYKLAFSTDTRTVLLIDEPENSLHMAWISSMLEDYKRMADDLKCQIIIATHSPAFINGRWDLSVDLYLNHTAYQQ